MKRFWLILLVLIFTAGYLIAQSTEIFPPWIDRIPPDGTFWGIGNARMSNVQMSIRTAEQRAQIDIFTKIAHAEGTVTTEESGRTIVNATLYGQATVIERYQAPDDTMWVLMEYTPLEGFSYKLNNGVATITNYTGPGGIISIPNEIDGHPVVSIGSGAFSVSRSTQRSRSMSESGTVELNIIIHRGPKSPVNTIIIPIGISDIRHDSFTEINGLNSINVISGNLNYSSLDGVLFDKTRETLIAFPTSKNEAYTIPDSVTAIGNRAFYKCSGLTSVVISSSVKTIGERAFNMCEGLISVTIVNGVIDIGNFAFAICKRLSSIIISDSVINIGIYAFSSCESLNAVTIGNGVTTIGNNAFSECKELKSVIIPDSVISIDDNAFLGCEGLNSLYIGSGVANIGTGAFYRCVNLTAIQVVMDNQNFSSHDGVFFNKTGTKLIAFPAGKTGIYTISSAVTSIGDGAFSGSRLTGVIIPDSVTELGRGVFNFNSELVSISFGNGLTSIGDNDFYGCDKLSPETRDILHTRFGVVPTLNLPF